MIWPWHGCARIWRMTSNASTSTPVTRGRVDELWSSTLAAHTPFLLARARALVVESCNEVLREHGLNVRTFSLLWLTTESFTPTQRQLSEFLDLDPSQIVALIDDLEEQGLVERRLNPADRRARQIVATASGKRLLAKLRVLVETTTAATFSGLTDEQRDQLQSLLLAVNLGAGRDR